MDVPKLLMMPRDRLPEAVERLMSLADEFVAPTRTERGDEFFAPVTGTDEIAWDWGNSLLTPVAYLYPPKEVLFSFELPAEGPPSLDYSLDERERIIFGIRPCDTHAIAHLDRFLLGGDFADSHYAARRRHTTLVTVACVEPASETCWCSCCGGGPVATEGFDLQLTPLGEDLLVEVMESGQALADAWEDLLQPAPGEMLALRDEQVQRTKEQLTTNAHMAAAIRRMTAGSVPEGFWEEVGARCMGCAGCSLVCPKCTCFNVVDELLAERKGRRVRMKDSCRLAGYSLEASGHNPRPTQGDRARRWSYHKLSYRYVERNGQHGCVGCGRCAVVCMGGVDMPWVAQQVREVSRSAIPVAAG